LQYGLGAWSDNIYFAYDLVAQLRPRLLVELGTDRGESYFAFCQSVRENETGTRCFAVDHWRGDPHTGSYDETTFADVDAHNRAHYARFSTLLRCSFDDALDRFPPESIDLLHIDGHHTEAAVRHDVDCWLPKLRPAGILLMHDVTMRGRDFGVWKVWAELAAHGRSWTFEQSPGLGVWQKPPSGPIPPLLEALFTVPNESKTVLTAYYRQRTGELNEKMAQEWRDGTIRSAPMASQTIIQIFWRSEGDYCEKNSTDARLGHQVWKEIAVTLPTATSVSGVRIDFVSPLTIIEIAAIKVETKSGSILFHATMAAEFESIALLGDCVRLASDPLTIKVTGIDPQMHLPTLPATNEGLEVVVQMRLRVLSS
jgi:hypothetical protein